MPPWSALGRDRAIVLESNSRGDGLRAGRRGARVEPLVDGDEERRLHHARDDREHHGPADDHDGKRLLRRTTTGIRRAAATTRWITSRRPLGS